MSVEKNLTVVMVTDFKAPDFRMTILLRVTGYQVIMGFW